MLSSDALQQLKQLKQDIKSSRNLQEGIVRASMGKFGFLITDDGASHYLADEQMQRVFPGDRVEAEITEDSQQRTSAVIEKLVNSPLKQFVGRYITRGSAHFVAPDLQGMSRWIFLPPSQRAKAQEGDYLVCEITRHPFQDSKAQAKVTRVIGKPGDAFIERTYALAKFNLSDAWTAGELAQEKQILADGLDAARTGRVDLSALPFVTIDNPSTLDMDDALHAERLDDGAWRLRIAVADPAALIASGSALDQAAAQRANTLYFPGRPRTMLPETLSHDLLSLVPNQDRLALVCRLEVTPDGCIRNYQFDNVVIRSHAKLGYDQVAKDLANGSTDATLSWASSLQALADVAAALRQWRKDNALIGQDRPDYDYEVDASGRLVAIHRADPNPARKMVEDCMIAANRCAADLLAVTEGPRLFVTHRGFRPDRLDMVRSLIGKDAMLKNLNPEAPADFCELLSTELRIDASPVRAILQRLLTRAELSETAAPHCGMGLPSYTTFTSPIRRYQDLLVHRLIKARLSDAVASATALDTLQEANQIGRQAVSETERWLGRQFADTLVGQTLTGTVSRILSVGAQVTLDDTGLTGFLSTRDMSQKFSFDPTLMTLTGGGKRFALDDSVQVVVQSVDHDRQQIQLSLTATAAS